MYRNWSSSFTSLTRSLWRPFHACQSQIPTSSPAKTRMSRSVSTTIAQGKNAQTPRPSASLVIVNERNEVLLVHRNPQARFFGGVHVFPGGNLDAKQDESLAMTAIRETFEESGLLIASSKSSASSPPLDGTLLDNARHAIHSQKTLFQTFLAEHQLKADVSSLLPFTEWVTPVNAPRRFRTQFYVAFLPASPSSGFSSGDKQERIPKPDGGQEVISARFIRPGDALAECREGKITFMPPQFYILSTLSSILQGPTNTKTQREQVETLSRGMFGRMVINPRRLREPDSDGRTILTYEGDETRGGSKGRLHRVLVKLDTAGIITSDITLLRNFDIFSEIEPQVFSAPSKL